MAWKWFSCGGIVRGLAAFRRDLRTLAFIRWAERARELNLGLAGANALLPPHQSVPPLPETAEEVCGADARRTHTAEGGGRGRREEEVEKVRGGRRRAEALPSVRQNQTK